AAPIGTVSPAGTAWSNVPAASALSSAVAFSVSISAIGWPPATGDRSGAIQRVKGTKSSFAMGRGARRIQISSDKSHSFGDRRPRLNLSALACVLLASVRVMHRDDLAGAGFARPPTRGSGGVPGCALNLFRPKRAAPAPRSLMNSQYITKTYYCSCIERLALTFIA